MPTIRKSLTDRQRFWRDHLRRCRASGQTVAAYAAANDLSAHGLYGAQRQSPRAESKRSESLPVAVTSSSSRCFVRVATPAPVALPCRVHLPNGVLVEVGVDTAGLGAVLRSLAALP